MITSSWYVCCMYTLYTKLFSDAWLVLCEMYVVCIHCILNDSYSWLVLCDMYVVCIHCILIDSLFLISSLWYVCCMYTLYTKRLFLFLISSLWYVCCMYTLYTKLFSDSWLVLCDMYDVCIHCILNDYLFFISSLWYVCCMYTLYTKLFSDAWLVLCEMYVVCIHCILSDLFILD